MNIRDIVDVQKIVEIMKAWSTACHMATICLDANGEYVTGQIGFTDFCTKYTRLTEEGEKRCKYCDMHNEGVYYCHAGLMDFGFDIVLYDGQVVGRIIGGQVLPKPVDEEKIIALADKLEIPREQYLDAARRVPLRDEAAIRASAFLLDKIINYQVNAEYARIMQEKYIKKLDKTSKCDSLTGLYNNKYCKEFVDTLIAERQSFALYILDLDGYKKVNDTYGHLFGDKVLKSFADLIVNLKPDGAVAGRHGGDEFIIITPACSFEEVRRLAKEIQSSSGALVFEENPEFRLSLSIGISIYPNHGNHAEELYENADTALYKVKEQGGSGYLVYKHSMKEERPVLAGSCN